MAGPEQVTLTFFCFCKRKNGIACALQLLSIHGQLCGKATATKGRTFQEIIQAYIAAAIFCGPGASLQLHFLQSKRFLPFPEKRHVLQGSKVNHDVFCQVAAAFAKFFLLSCQTLLLVSNHDQTAHKQSKKQEKKEKAQAEFYPEGRRFFTAHHHAGSGG